VTDQLVTRTLEKFLGFAVEEREAPLAVEREERVTDRLERDRQAIGQGTLTGTVAVLALQHVQQQGGSALDPDHPHLERLVRQRAPLAAYCVPTDLPSGRRLTSEARFTATRRFWALDSPESP